MMKGPAARDALALIVSWCAPAASAIAVSRWTAGEIDVARTALTGVPAGSIRDSVRSEAPSTRTLTNVLAPRSIGMLAVPPGAISRVTGACASSDALSTIQDSQDSRRIGVS